MSAPYGRTFALWRAAAGPDWDGYTRHPFVEGLGDGSLPQSEFMAYLVQDYLFLGHFARAWALATVKAGDLDEMRACAATVATLLDHELDHHARTCAQAGIPAEALALAEEADTTIAYTRYVLDAGLSGGFPDMLAALMPCVLGYGEIGLRLAREAAPDTPYRDWIDAYAGERYQNACHRAGALLDRAIDRRLGARAQESPMWFDLARRFATATRLEISFWDLGRA